jgi:hypothetical protein
MTRAKLQVREAYALEAVFPHLEKYLVRMDVAPYVVAPISSDKKWKEFVNTLETFSETSREWGTGSVGTLLYGNDSSMQGEIRVPHQSVRSML